MGSERISLERLKSAMRRNGSLDGHRRVLKLAGPKILEQQFRPPFVLAGYQDEPLLGSKRAENSDRLSVRDFEILSLAARIALLNSARCRSDLDAAQNLAVTALLRRDKDLNVSLDEFPTVYANDINEALAWAGEQVDPTTSSMGQRQGGPTSRELLSRQAIRGGLQLIGCRIVADPSRSGAGEIRLTNARLPYSLRLIGCVIECPINTNNCELGTLDLSGSAMVGLSGTYLVANGSLRMRRSMVMAAVDLAGARIRGVFDGSDCLIAPNIRRPTFQAYDADRGMLNLSQATIENDVLLDRARIWGGLSLRGAETRRSVFMNDAVFSAPIALVERMAADICATRASATNFPTQVDYAKKLAEQLLHHPYLPGPDVTTATARSSSVGGVQTANTSPSPATSVPGGRVRVGEKVKALVSWETLEGMGWNGDRLKDLLSQSMRTRTSALRGDGLKVQGSVFARGLKANGRVRLKYSSIAGGLHMDGARLRSVAAIGEELDKIPAAVFKASAIAGELKSLHQLRLKTRFKAQLAEGAFDDDYALDARDSSIQGDFSLGSVSEGESEEAKKRAELGFSDSEVFNANAAKRAWHQAFEREYAAATVAGVVTLAGSSIGGSANFKRLRSTLKPKSVRQEEISYEAQGKADIKYYIKLGTLGYTVDLAHCNIGDDVDFRESRNIFGLNLEHSKVDGCVRFSKKSSGESDSRNRHKASKIRCEERAIQLRGRINLRGTSVRGDVLLVFDRNNGPDIYGELVQIDGRLDIYPAAIDIKGSDRITDDFSMDDKTYEKQCKNDGVTLNQLKIDAEKEPDPSVWLEREQSRFIDLRNGRSKVLCHPPPAWPYPEGLSISEFKYERATDIGPLAPHPFINSASKSKTTILYLAGIFLSCVVLAHEIYFMLSNPGNQGMIKYFGFGNVTASILILVVILINEILKKQYPNAATFSPMAIHYLKL